MLKDKLQADIKTAMLGGDKFTAEVLKGLKSVILYEEVAKNKRDEGLSDTEIEAVLVREAKKRVESADLYEQGGNQEKANQERREKEIIEHYLPKQLSDEELDEIVHSIIKALENPQIGPVIGAVKAKVGSSAEGARVAASVQKALNN